MRDDDEKLLMARESESVVRANSSSLTQLLAIFDEDSNIDMINRLRHVKDDVIKVNNLTVSAQHMLNNSGYY